MDGAADLMVMQREYFGKILKEYPILYIYCEDGKYDIDMIEEMVLHNIENYGSIGLDILGGHYTFDANDIRNLRSMM